MRRLSALAVAAHPASEAAIASEFANRGRVVPEFGDQSIRELFLGSQRMIYQVTAERVFIIGLVHGARDLAAAWLRENRTGTHEP
jgi:plasmid stabilization system protein ParE